MGSNTFCSHFPRLVSILFRISLPYPTLSFLADKPASVYLTHFRGMPFAVFHFFLVFQRSQAFFDINPLVPCPNCFLLVILSFPRFFNEITCLLSQSISRRVAQLPSSHPWSWCFAFVLLWVIIYIPLITTPSTYLYATINSMYSGNLLPASLLLAS